MSHELQDSLASSATHLLQWIDDGVVVLDDQLRVTALNTAALGYLDVTASELQGTSLESAFPSTDSAIRERLLSARHTDEPIEFELDDQERDARLALTIAPSSSGVVVFFEDVTQTDEDSQPLERFRAALDHSTDSILIIDPVESRILDANETACKRLGYSRAELETMAPWDIEERLSGAEEWADHVRTLRKSGSLTFDGYHRRKDGTTFPVEVELSITIEDDGTEILVAVARDVTDRRDRLRELQRFQLAVEHAGHAIYITDTDGTIEYVNPAFEETTGYTTSEVLGRNPRLLQSGRMDEEYYETLWETIENGDIFHEAVPNRRKNGELYWADQIIAPILEDGHPIAYVAIQRDITDRIEHEQELELLRTLVDSANDAVYAIDQETGSIEYANDTASDMLGYDRDEYAEMTAVDISTMFETIDDFHEHVDSSEGTQTRTVGHDHRRKNGTTVPVEVSAKSVSFDDDLYRIAIARDISDRRARMGELEEYQRSLERLNDATIELLRTDSRVQLRDHILDATADIFADGDVAYLAFDQEANALHPVDIKGMDLAGDQSEIQSKPGDSIIWEAFADATVREVRDVDEPWIRAEGPETWLLIPIEGEGLVLVGRRSDSPFQDRAVEIAKLVSTVGEDAFERIAWEAQLREKRGELELTNRRLSELTRVNEHVRKLQNGLLQAETRDEIERDVCQSLGQLEDVELVWIGGYQPGQDAIEPRAWAGGRETYLDATDFEVIEDNRAPSVRTVDQGHPVGIQSVADRLDEGEWYRSALKQGFGSALSVPISHDDVLYGVLTVYESAPMSFLEQREVVFAELGETIARAITMVEQRRSLGSGDRIELEFETDEVDSPCAVMARKLDTAMTVDGIVSRGEETYYIYGEAEDTTASKIRSAADEIPSLRQIRILDEDETTVQFELRTDHRIPPVTIVESGGKFHQVRVTPTECRLLGSYHDAAQINTVIDSFTKRHPAWQLRARRRQGTLTGAVGSDRARERLTDRQFEILSAAFHSGYFEWHRKTTGEELAEMFDVSPPTVYRHLRLGLRELVASSVDDQPGE
jgi:PAS domain S-box-containing protein